MRPLGIVAILLATILGAVAQLKVSSDGSCGNGTTCTGSGFGDCCSEHGWCGDSQDYCNEFCQLQWGICNDPSKGNSITYWTHTLTETDTVMSTTVVPQTSLVYATKSVTQVITIRSTTINTWNYTR
jgi:hypothetical protein